MQLPVALSSPAAVLAELDLRGEVVMHCLLDGNVAPFVQPHDWTTVLKRLPSMKSLTVVYIDIGSVDDSPGCPPPPMPYGTLVRPTEEGRVGDRAVHVARFLGTYAEFVDHCLELPGLVVPTVAVWTDLPFYGFGGDDFNVRLEAYSLLAARGAPSILTFGGEIPQKHGPPMVPRPDDCARQSMAGLDAGIGAHMALDWHWNRFVVPLDRGSQGILAGHAIIGVVRPKAQNGSTQTFSGSAIEETLRKRSVNLTPFKLPDIAPDVELRSKQWEAFCETMRLAGRPVGAACDEQERNRQSMEFYQFCGMGDQLVGAM